MWSVKNGEIALFLVAISVLSGCDMQDMFKQGKREPLSQSKFFENDASARPPVPDTIAQGHLNADKVFYTGKLNGKEVENMPEPVTRQLLLRGQSRFDIFCATCHDRTGSGNGMIVQRGYKRPPSYHTPLLRKMPIGHFFDVPTEGFGIMPDYAAQIPPADRWAIASYVRALQLSQYAALADVPEGEQEQLKITEAGK